MDTMFINSRFITGILSKLVSKTVSKNLDCDTDITIEEVELKFDGNKVRVRLVASGDMAVDDLKKLTSKMGL